MDLTSRQIAYLKELRAGVEDRPFEKVFRRWMRDPDFVAARNELLGDSIRSAAPSGVMSVAADHLLAAAAAADDANDARVRSHLDVYHACLAWPDRGDAAAGDDAEADVRDG